MKEDTYNHNRFAPVLVALAVMLCVFSASSAHAACTNPTADDGSIIYNADQNVPQVCAGSTWIALGKLNPAAGGGGCNNPTGVEGQIVYNGDLHVPQYCDGTDWRQMINVVSGSNLGQACGGGYYAGQIILGGTTYDLIAQMTDAPSTMTWGPSGVDEGAADYNDGAANTATLVGLAGSYPAAEYCDALTEGGHSDWYLPSQNEFSIMGQLEPIINNFSTSSYATSTQAGTSTTDFRWAKSSQNNTPFNTGAQAKTNSVPVRCMRRAPAGTCLGATIQASATCPLGTGSNEAPDSILDFFDGLWYDGTYLYAAPDAPTVSAYSFDGTNFTVLNTTAVTNGAEDIWGDGTYIYFTDGIAGIGATTFNGTSFSAPVTYNTTGTAHAIWGDGTYIYVADGASGVEAFTFNGSAWTLKDTYNTPGDAAGVWGDGTYIYVADSSSVIALTFNGTTFSAVGTPYSNPGTAGDIAGDGTYLYLADGYDGLEVLTFDGSTFTMVAQSNQAMDYADRVNVFGNYAYVAAANTGGAYRYDGSTISVLGYFPPTYGGINNMFSDGTYTYVVDGYNGLIAYPACN